MAEPTLYLVFLGGDLAPGRMGEDHEVGVVVADDVESARGNAGAAHSLLLKTYESVSSNQGLYYKILAIVGLFGVFFTIFLL
jgi:hypothetical protein